MNKFRNTIQRDLVLEAARHLNHPTADDIYTAVSKAHPSISRGTVYRNLGLLVSQGLLRRIGASGADHYDARLSGHYHISCRVCGKLVDADLPYFANLLSQLIDTHGFLVEEHDILLRGVCPDCQSTPHPCQ